MALNPQPDRTAVEEPYPYRKYFIALIGFGVLAVIGLLLWHDEDSPIIDCGWWATGHAWVDTNLNGRLDPGEPPLAGVTFVVDDTENDFQNVGEPAVSDTTGQSDLYVFIPGCPRTAFAVTAHAPPGYRNTTPAHQQAPLESTLYFGFVRDNSR